MENYSGSSSLQTRDKRQAPPQNVNVGETERVVSTAGGAAIAVYGLTRWSLPGLALAAVGGMLISRGLTGYCPLYAAANLDTSEPGAASGAHSGVHITESMTIRCPRSEVYRSWRALEKLPRFMHHIASVKEIDDKISEWRAPLPKGMGTISWKAEMTEDRQDERIAWRSLPDADLQNAGRVTFRDAPGDRGTEIKVDIDYRPPAGKLGRAAAGLFNPAFSKMIRADLRRFKALMETGEIPTTEGQPSGK